MHSVKIRPADKHSGKTPAIGYSPVGKNNRQQLRNIIGPLQAKLKIGPQNDRFEQEADRIAEQVMSMPDTELGAAQHTEPISPLAGNIQRMCQDCEEEETVQQKPLSIQRMSEDEAEETVQQKTLSIQRMSDTEEEETLQQKAISMQRVSEDEQEEPVIQTKAKGETTATNDVVSRVQALKSGGTPMPQPSRTFFEPRFGQDFSSVKVHTGSEAGQLASDINARAFTVGNHIVFGSGEYQPHTDSGKRLMGHELTHVVQQGGADHKVMRATPSSSSSSSSPSSSPATAPAPASAAAPTPAGAQNAAGTGATTAPPTPAALAAALPFKVGRRVNDVITFDKIELPGFKLSEPHRKALYDERTPLQQKKGFVRNDAQGKDPAQRKLWKSEALTDDGTVKVTEELAKKYERDKRVAPGPNENVVFQWQDSHFYTGTLAHIAQELTLPSWDKQGKFHQYDVDHIVELQLANWNTDGFGNTIRNMELLDGQKNKSSGAIVKSNIDSKVGAFIKATSGQFGDSIAKVKRDHHLVFQTAVKGKKGDRTTRKSDYWTQQEINQARQVRFLKTSDLSRMGGADKVNIFPSEGGGQRTGFPMAEGAKKPQKTYLKPFVVTDWAFNTDEIEPGESGSAEIGSLTFNIPEGHEKYKPFENGDERLPIKRFPGARYAGYADKKALRSKLKQFRVNRLSPVEIAELNIMPEGGIHASGQILPDTPMLQGNGIDFSMRGEDLTFSKTFAGPDLNVPAPFGIDQSDLTLSYSTTSGFGVSGGVDFAIDNVGNGSFIGGAAMEGGLALEGLFNFNEGIFGQGESAQVRVAYSEGQWSMGGTVSIPEGQVPGVKSATIDVNYGEATGFSAEGDAELDVPGVEKGRLAISQSDEAGFEIAGEFNLTSEIPGINGGYIGGKIRQKPEGEGYSFSAVGQAMPDIPGVNAVLTVNYDDGAFTAEAMASYERGMLSGQINVGVTNQPVVEDGEAAVSSSPDALMASAVSTAPEGSSVAGSNNPLTVYGGGELTLQIAPWLQGTAGVQFAPNGEITVSGEIGLPDELELFKRKAIDKPLFNIAVQAPIVPGVVAEIGGGLKAEAGVGPGVIDNLRLGINYNPAREAETTVYGSASAKIPADAGLRLSTRVGIGLGITGASVTGGLEVGGTLGIEGTAKADVDVNWTPSTGLDIEATASIEGSPSFTFDISGYVSVKGLGYEIYGKSWELASFRYGSDLAFGVTMPVRYQEGQPFSLSTDDIQFKRPNIDIDSLLKGLVNKIT